MSAQMLAGASKGASDGTGETVDEMRLLEEQARIIAEETTSAAADQPPKKTMNFVK